jgi:hypothetical protein
MKQVEMETLTEKVTKGRIIKERWVRRKKESKEERKLGEGKSE